MRPMRLLLLGAFAYPHEQGSQVYFQEQAIALRAAGAEVHLMTYGAPIAAESGCRDPDRWRALDGFGHTSLPTWVAPTSPRSGPQLGKPFADLCLALALRRILRGGPAGAIRPSDFAVGHDADPNASWTASNPWRGVASNSASRAASRDVPTSRPDRLSRAAEAAAPTGLLTPEESGAFPARRPAREGFDAILAHHAEAALAAILAVALCDSRPAIVYCAHTRLEQELPTYLDRRARFDGQSENPSLGARQTGSPASGQRRTRRALADRWAASLGRAIDRGLARRADGWIALTQSSERVMAASSHGPGRVIAPPVDDGEHDPLRLDPASVARSHGLEPGRFFLYTGNLDPYQELPLLAETARLRAERAGAGSAPGAGFAPLVVATHDASLEESAARAIETFEAPGLRALRVRTAAESRALLAAARASVVTRRTLGGFPIKLANSLAAGTPVVAFHAAEWGLRDGHDSLIGDPARPAASLVEALDRLESDDALAARLGAGARATYLAHHRPDQAAARTLELIEEILTRRRP